MSCKENLISLIISLSESLYEEWTPFVPCRYIVFDENGDSIISEEVLLQSTEEELFSLLSIFKKLKEQEGIQEETKKLSCFMDTGQRTEVIKALVHYGPPQTDDYQLPENDFVKRFAVFADGTYGIIGWEYFDHHLERASDEELVELLLAECKYLQDKCDKYFPSYDRECLEALIGKKRGNAE